MIQRIAQANVLRYARQYPVVTITGPRQSGKTTLCKMAFPAKRYLSLEDLDVRNYARRDPRGFVEEAAQTAAAECSPIDDVRGTACYRRNAVAQLVGRGLGALAARM